MIIDVQHPIDIIRYLPIIFIMFHNYIEVRIRDVAFKLPAPRHLRRPSPLHLGQKWRPAEADGSAGASATETLHQS